MPHRCGLTARSRKTIDEDSGHQVAEVRYSSSLSTALWKSKGGKAYHLGHGTDDMRRLCKSPNTSTLVGKRDAALLATLASSGLRASELATLTTRQIRKQGSKGFVLQVKGKTDIEYRDAHLSKEAHSLIMAWMDAQLAAGVISPYIFTSFAGRGGRVTEEAMSETAVWLTVQKYAKQAGLEHIKPHDFRWFVGTQLARRDIRKAQLALGHKSIEVTARHYVLDRLEAGETDNLY